MINIIKDNKISTGNDTLNISKSSRKNINGRRSLYVVRDIKKGEKINLDNVRSVRPRYGLHPKFFNKVLNKRAKINLEAGNPLKLSYLR